MPISTHRRSFLFFIAAVGTIFLFASGAIAQLSERDRGIGLYLDREYAKAIEVLTQVFEADKKDKKVCLYLAAAHFKINDKDSVKKTIRRCRKITKKIRQPADELYDTPLNITERRHARYTEEARVRGIAGQIELLVEFRADGIIGSIITIRELGGGLTENALDAARNIKFEPATRNGRTVADIKLVTYSFDIY